MIENNNYIYKNKSLEILAKQYNKDLREFDLITDKYDKPIEIFRLAKEQIKLSIIEDDNIENYGELKANDKKIIIKKRQDIFLKRFAVAHELGHYVKGHGDSAMSSCELFPDDTKEYEANDFAYELLMPEYKIIEIWNEKKYSKKKILTAIKYLSAFFAVPENIFSTRIGLILDKLKDNKKGFFK